MKTAPHPTSTDVQFDRAVVLGLREPDVVGWQRVRDAQFAVLAGMKPFHFAAHGFAALACAIMLFEEVPPALLGGWLAAVAALLLHAIYFHRRSMHALRPSSAAAMRNVTLRFTLLGLLWVLPPAVFAGMGGLDDQLAICLLCGAMMASAAFTASAVPMAMLAYLAIAGVGLAAMMAQSGSPLIAVLPIVYGLALAAGGMAAARALLRRTWVEHKLADQSETVSLLLREFEDGADWLWQLDGAKRLQAVSPRFARAAGRPVTELEGLSLLELVAGDAWQTIDPSPSLNRLIDQLNARESFADLLVAARIGGEERWWSLSAAPRYDDRGAFIGHRGVGSDVTEQRRSAARIEDMARFDALTGLANRAAFMDGFRDTLARVFQSGGRSALLLVDLDKFKPVNDTLGHPVGDRLLKQVAERLRAQLGPGDLAGRLGGDEFAVLLGDAGDPGRVEQMADRILAALARPFEIDEHVIRIGCSIGSALAPRDGRSMDALMRCADLGLYRAKDEGRGTHRRYDPSMQAETGRRQAMEAALREALEAGQFHLVYQPVVDSQNGYIESFEALIRWTHPELGDVPPARFLPIAEKARLSGRIGEWVLRTACAEAARWPEDIRVSVNLCAEQLRDRRLSTSVLQALSQAGLAASRLTLEVPEALYLADNDAVSGVLDSLQGLGVGIALDDYGTALASLGYVRHRRFSTIKIDNEHVRGAAAGLPTALAVVRSAVALADALGMVAVAEGAETVADVSRARELGCRRVQGHLAGMPMSAEAVRALVAPSDDQASAA